MTDIPFGRATHNFKGWKERKIWAPLVSVVFGPWLPFETSLGSWQWGDCIGNHSLLIRGTETTVIHEGEATTLSGSQIETEANARVFPDLPGLFTFEVEVGVQNMRSYKFRMDANASIEVYGSGVTVTLLGPAGAFVDGFGGGTPTGVVDPEFLSADTLVSPCVMAVESAGGGGSEVRYSERFTIPTMTQSVFTVPRYAKQLDIHVDGAAGVANWQSFLGNPALVGSRDLQTIVFTGQSSLGNPIGSASHIQTDSVVGARDVELIWTIRP